MIGGIDEAGRGPVLGPLVVAGVACPDDAVLAAMGVKDSKRLSAGKRERIARLIEDHPDTRVAIRVLEAADLDARRATETLNQIEVALFQEVGQELAARRLVVDAADVDAARFGRRIQSVVQTDVISEHKADDRHAVVAAASIIAKVRRDAEIDDLRRRLERRLPMELGSGYPSDPKTKAFLAEWVARHGDVPEGARRSWKTVADLLGPKQVGLDGF